jgi:hypothetical protein
MSFKDNYTTAAIKTPILNNEKTPAEIKNLESAKIEVSNDAFLNAEMQEKLIDKIEHARLSMMGK